MLTDEIIAGYPGLTDAALDAALAYAAELALEGTVPLPRNRRVTFKIDENLPKPKDDAELLRNHGCDAETVREENLAGAGDDIIAATIERENCVLIALDLDFSDIRTYPPEHYSGIVVLRPKAQDKIDYGLIAKAFEGAREQPPGSGPLDCRARQNSVSSIRLDRRATLKSHRD